MSELFDLACKSVNGLINEWTLEDPKTEFLKAQYKIKVSSKKFEGFIEVNGDTLSISGSFKSLFRFDKDETEKRLNHWLQNVFRVTYDS